jgi:hypothetical protein
MFIKGKTIHRRVRTEGRFNVFGVL